MSKPIELKVVGNESDAIRMCDALERRLNRLEEAGKRSNKAAKDSAAAAAAENQKHASAIDGVVDKYVKLAAGIQAAANLASGFGATVEAALAPTLKLFEDIDKFREKWAESDVKLGVQGNLSPEQRQALTPIVSQKMLETPVTNDLTKGFNITTALAGTGLPEGEIKSGSGLKSVLRLQAATAAAGENFGDEKETVKAISQFIKANGGEVNAAALERTGGKVAEIYASSDMELSDLSALAKRAGNFKRFGLDESTQIAAFSAARDVLGPDVAATSMDAFVTRLGAAGATDERIKALDKIGLTTKDVALSNAPGKDFFSVTERLKSRLGGMDAEAKNVFLEEVFGQEGSKFASLALSEKGFGTIKGRFGDVQNLDKFQGSVDRFNDSRFAQGNRSALLEQAGQADILTRSPMTWGEHDQAKAAYWAQVRAKATRGGELPEWISHAGAGLAEGFDNALTGAARRMGAQPADFGFDKEATKQLLKAIEYQNQLVEKQIKLLENKPVARNGQGD